ncbi:Hydroxyacid oxidase 1 [Eumeta japonica]|uniref:Hydroxyacid oxidase 1 n=1 Tax=Eumeta variegata TaxID=151549 RepID=A0A4C1UZ63_EUMVA|nr:Hydroxyacid oxidase 1 [Eumeta japonica]
MPWSSTPMDTRNASGASCEIIEYQMEGRGGNGPLELSLTGRNATVESASSCILRADDAERAVQVGCSAIIVSNHGARQLDGVPATIEALPEVVEAMKKYKVEVYLDGGVGTGTDVFKALALGARMVFVGRPALWGLTVGGQAGVQRMLNILKTEIEYTLLIAGTPTVEHITRDMVVHQSAYSKL